MSPPFSFRSWHKLDNTAHLFPVTANRKTPNVFRLTAILTQPVDPALLQRAAAEVLPYFPAFNVRLRHGLFWNYLETNDTPVPVRPETQSPCRYLDPLETGRYLFRILYFKNRVHLETFHILTDGTGALRFLKALCYRYWQLARPELDDGRLYGLEGAGNLQDCYLKYTRPAEKSTYREPTAYHLHAPTRTAGDVGVVTLLMPASGLKELCRAQNATVGVYLTAALLAAAREEYMSAGGSKKPMNAFVPVNLRRIFGGETSLNFFSGFTVSVPFGPGPADFSALLAETSRQFAEKCTEAAFAEKLAYTSRGQLNPFARVLPLPVKNAALRAIYERSNHGSSFTFSNLGPVPVEAPFSGCFSGFRFLLSPGRGEPVKCSACTYGGTLSLSFTGVLQENRLARHMARFLAGQGLPVTVESNGDADETM